MNHLHPLAPVASLRSPLQRHREARIGRLYRGLPAKRSLGPPDRDQLSACCDEGGLARWTELRIYARRKAYDGDCSDGDCANMILELSAGSSWLVRGAAAVVLAVHIGGAGIGLLSGAAALAFRKGQRMHRIAGHVFFVSMLIMSAIGACVAPFLPRPQWS